jgi:myo-inositol 2-dehydrogenase/D-chiro-inositol 1-dehydrogenase
MESHPLKATARASRKVIQNFGNINDNYEEMKDRSFIESITGNKFQNQIAAGVDSARTCMMARKSAETGRTVTWQDIEADTEQYQLGIEIRKFV